MGNVSPLGSTHVGRSTRWCSLQDWNKNISLGLKSLEWTWRLNSTEWRAGKDPVRVRDGENGGFSWEMKSVLSIDNVWSLKGSDPPEICGCWLLFGIISEALLILVVWLMSWHQHLEKEKQYIRCLMIILSSTATSPIIWPFPPAVNTVGCNGSLHPEFLGFLIESWVHLWDWKLVDKEYGPWISPPLAPPLAHQSLHKLETGTISSGYFIAVCQKIIAISTQNCDDCNEIDAPKVGWHITYRMSCASCLYLLSLPPTLSSTVILQKMCLFAYIPSTSICWTFTSVSRLDLNELFEEAVPNTLPYPALSTVLTLPLPRASAVHSTLLSLYLSCCVAMICLHDWLPF